MILKILLVILSTILGLFGGLVFGGLTVAKNSGLAGSANVLGYGLIIAILFLIVSLFLMRKFNRHLLIKINIVLLVLVLICFGWVGYKTLTNHPKGIDSSPKLKTVAPSALMISKFLISYKASMGMGFCKPKFFENDVLYFYNPNLQKSPMDHTPVDSIVFNRGDGFMEITYAPPYFVPEYMKIDYDMLYLKVLTFGLDWIEVEVNKTSGQSGWVSSSAVEFMSWQEFLLKANSLDNIDEKNNPLRIKPLDNASELVNPQYEFLIPLLVKGDWVKVELRNELHLNTPKTGWIRWTNGKKLLVEINLLS